MMRIFEGQAWVTMQDLNVFVKFKLFLIGRSQCLGQCELLPTG